MFYRGEILAIMSGLRIGDLKLDPRRVVMVNSLNTLVCSDLISALSVGIAGGLRIVVERLDQCLELYQPTDLVILGRFSKDAPFSMVARRWGQRARIHLVSGEQDSVARARAESQGLEVHHELLLGAYRFACGRTKSALGDLGFPVQNILGAPHFSIRLGPMRPFRGIGVPVFVKGQGSLHLPSFVPVHQSQSILSRNLKMDRHDVLAIGHHRVLPLGKVRELRQVKTLTHGVSLEKAVSLGRVEITRKKKPSGQGLEHH